MYASPISSNSKNGIYLAQSLLYGASTKCMMFDNGIPCSEEGEDGSATGMGVPNLERGTAKFEIIGLDVRGLVAQVPNDVSLLSLTCGHVENLLTMLYRGIEHSPTPLR